MARIEQGGGVRCTNDCINRTHPVSRGSCVTVRQGGPSREVVGHDETLYPSGGAETGHEGLAEYGSE
jgi:hypothetical protein